MGLPSKQVNSCQILSRIATGDGHGENSTYFDGWKAYDSDPFHPTLNPRGVIQMGLAENQLCHDLIQEWMRKNPQASICTNEGIPAFKEIANFQDYHGLASFRRAVAKFMEKARGGRAKFDPDRIVMSGGATGAQETVAFCLANPGEAYLVPTPYYPGFDRDLRWRTGVELFPIPCHSSNKFKLTQSALESAYANAQKSNIRVKGVLITNPSNPLGTTMDRDTLTTLVNFVNDKQIHLICDEIFSGTVFDGPGFVSVAEIIQRNPHCNRDLFHIVYSLSKDLGVPGFRVGIIYSYNDAVVSCARKMSSFGLVSSQTQHLLAAMLGDDQFTTEFLAESRRRLSQRHNKFTAGLKHVGIGCLESNAGLFCWMDLRQLLKAATVEAELELWRVIVNEVKLNISPGASFHCSEPGWFRVCFANMDDETMEKALVRIRAFVFRKNPAAAVAKGKKRWDPTKRLSLPRRFDEMMTPQLMSPRSPLVQAATFAQQNKKQTHVSKSIAMLGLGNLLQCLGVGDLLQLCARPDCVLLLLLLPFLPPFLLLFLVPPDLLLELSYALLVHTHELLLLVPELEGGSERIDNWRLHKLTGPSELTIGAEVGRRPLVVEMGLQS